MEGLAGTEVEREVARVEPEVEPDVSPGSDVPARTGRPAPRRSSPGSSPKASLTASQRAAPEALPTIRARTTHRLVRVVSVDVALPDQYPTVTLEDTEEGRDRLGFRIGTAEGVALAHVLAGTTAPRPLTHDLFALAMERFGVEILAVRLTGRVGTTYLAEVELVGPAGRQVLSCRPSDGICLALRQRVPAPLLCDERLFVVTGDVPPPEDRDDQDDLQVPARFEDPGRPEAGADA